jgi:ankyrin repeat protein
LLDCGADVNINAGYFGNALQAWCYVGNKDIVGIFHDKGADPNAHGGFYETPLIAAVHERHEPIVRLLMNHGAKVNFVTTSFGTALGYATRLIHQSTSHEEQKMYDRIIQVLTNYEHDVGWSP